MAVWFIGVFVVQFTAVLIYGAATGAMVLDLTAVFWLAVAAGIYFRLGAVRRLVLLFGSMAMLSAIIVGPLAVAGRTEDPEIRLGGTVIKDPPVWIQVTVIAAFAACFSYPVLVLWPRETRVFFRDRLPASRRWEKIADRLEEQQSADVENVERDRRLDATDEFFKR